MIRNIRKLSSTLKGKSDKTGLMKKIITILVYAAFVCIMAAVYVEWEYETDRANRADFGAELHTSTVEVERKCPKLCSNEISEVTFRNFVKGKFDDIIDLKDHLGIGDDYRNEAWGFLGSLFFVITTTTTIGYGFPAPKTVRGKVTTMALYMVGVPFAFMALIDVVDLILIFEKAVLNQLDDKFKSMRIKLRNKLSRLYDIMCCKKNNRVTPSGKSKAQKRKTLEEVLKAIETVDTSGSGKDSPKLHMDNRSSAAYVHKSPATSIKSGSKSPAMSGKMAKASSLGHMSGLEVKTSNKSTRYSPKRIRSHSDKEDIETGHIAAKATPVSRLTNPSTSLSGATSEVMDCGGPASRHVFNSSAESTAREDRNTRPVFYVGSDAEFRKQNTSSNNNSFITNYEDNNRQSWISRFLRYIKTSIGSSGEDTGDIETGLIYDQNNSNNVNKGEARRIWPKSIRQLIDRLTNRNKSEQNVDNNVATLSEKPADIKPGETVNKKGKKSSKSHHHHDKGSHHHKHESIQRMGICTPVPALHKQALIGAGPSGLSQDLPKLHNSCMHSGQHNASTAVNIQDKAGLSGLNKHSESTLQKQQSNAAGCIHTPRVSSQHIHRQPHHVTTPTHSGVCMHTPGPSTQNLHSHHQQMHSPIGSKRHIAYVPHNESHNVIMSHISDANLSPKAGNDAIYSKSHTGHPTIHQKPHGYRAGACTSSTIRRLSDTGNSVHFNLQDPSAISARYNPSIVSMLSSAQMTATQSVLRKNSKEHKSKQSVQEAVNSKKSRSYLSEVESGVNLSLLFTMVNLVVYLIGGSYMYVSYEGWSYLDAVYFILTSISTVGFGDILPKSSQIFILLSSLYILLGLALLAKIITDIRHAMFDFMMNTVSQIESVGKSAKKKLAKSARKMSIRTMSMKSLTKTSNSKEAKEKEKQQEQQQDKSSNQKVKNKPRSRRDSLLSNPSKEVVLNIKDYHQNHQFGLGASTSSASHYESKSIDGSRSRWPDHLVLPGHSAGSSMSTGVGTWVPGSSSHHHPHHHLPPPFIQAIPENSAADDGLPV